MSRARRLVLSILVTGWAGLTAPASAASARGIELADLERAIVKVRAKWSGQPRGPNPISGDETPRQSEGSGFFVLDAGWVLTANHVLCEVQDQFPPSRHTCTVEVQFRTRANKVIYREATIAGRDPHRDLALLCVKLEPGERPAGALPIPERMRGQEKLADETFMLGFPKGREQPRLVRGRVKELHTPESQGLLLLESSGSDPGESGAPVVSERGHLVGLFLGVDPPTNRDDRLRPIDANEPILATLVRYLDWERLQRDIWLGEKSKAKRLAIATSALLPAVYFGLESKDADDRLNRAIEDLPPRPGPAATREEQVTYNQRVSALNPLKEDRDNAEQDAQVAVAASLALTVWLGWRMCLWFCDKDEPIERPGCFSSRVSERVGSSWQIYTAGAAGRIALGVKIRMGAEP